MTSTPPLDPITASMFTRQKSESDIVASDIIASDHSSDTKSDKQYRRDALEEAVTFRRENTYRVCCWKVDRRVLSVFIQLLLTLMMLCFCFYQIAYGAPEQAGPVWGLIGTFVGYWFDAPKVH